MVWEEAVFGGVTYPDPPGGWTYLFTGDAAVAGPNNNYDSLDGTWDHNNDSDQWDDTVIGSGRPGGVNSLSEEGANFIRLQDTGDPRDYGMGDPGSNRKIFFAHSITNDVGSSGQSILDDGVTISFRVRIATGSPLDPQYPDTAVDGEPGTAGGAWPAEGDGFLGNFAGKGFLGIHQALGGLISFSPALGSESMKYDPSVCFDDPSVGGQDGLVTNGLNGTSLSEYVDSWENEGSLNLVLLATPRDWHEFWITIQADTTGLGTHKVTVFKDGSISGSEFVVTAGSASDYNDSYMTMGFVATAQMGAIDVDFVAYRVGVVVPLASYRATSPQPTDRAIGVPINTDLSWEPASEPGLTYQELFFGTDPAALVSIKIGDETLNNATSAEMAGPLDSETTYYWSVDSNLGAGLLWSFRTVFDIPYAYFKTVRDYADAMIEYGRDKYGSVHSPLFASTLDRATLSLMTGSLPSISGVRPNDRMPNGNNVQHHTEFFKTLYLLSDIIDEPNYADAADEALQWFYNNCQSPATSLMSWGEHLGWDFLLESRTQQHSGCGTHEFFGTWQVNSLPWGRFWEKSYNLCPQQFFDFAVGLWDHQIGDQATCNFSRHACYDYHGPGLNADYPRHAGFYIHTWGNAYARSTDSNFCDTMLMAIDGMVYALDVRRRVTEWTGSVPPGGIPSQTGSTTWWSDSELQLAIFSYEVADLVPEWLRQKILTMCANTDSVYLAYADGGVTWPQGYGLLPRNLLCLERYKQTGIEGYRTFFMDVADSYLTSDPSGLLFPSAFATAIQTMLEAYELTGNQQYLDRAHTFGQTALDVFFDQTSSLPKATSQHGHYEAITGGGVLALQLIELFEQSNYGDSEPDNDIDFNDLANLMLHWLDDTCTKENRCCNVSDIDHSGTVDSADFAKFARYWLKGVTW